MRKCLFFAGIFLLIVHFSNAQETSIFVKAINNWKNQNKLWTDEQVFAMTAQYKIQDSLFISPDLLNESYKILSYMPQNDLEIYCRDLQEGWNDLHEWKNYMREIRLIDQIDQWVRLLTKYPGIAQLYYEDQGGGSQAGFNDFIRKLKERELLIFIEESGSTLIVENTRDNYNKFRHFTRLK